MTETRFHMMTQAVRFDDLNRRTVEKMTLDNLAPVHEIFDEFVNACKTRYNVDIYPLLTKCCLLFKVNANFGSILKHSICGIKIYTLCNAFMYYTANIEIYPNKQP